MQYVRAGSSGLRYRFGLQYRLLNIRWVSVDESHHYCGVLDRIFIPTQPLVFFHKSFICPGRESPFRVLHLQKLLQGRSSRLLAFHGSEMLTCANMQFPCFHSACFFSSYCLFYSLFVGMNFPCY